MIVDIKTSPQIVMNITHGGPGPEVGAAVVREIERYERRGGRRVR